MTVRGYGRISLDNAKSGSIAKQRERIAGRAGGSMEWYADESVSGSKVAFGDRPDGARLLADLRPGDQVLVTKIDRAARSVRDLLDLVERIDGEGATITFIDQNIDTAGPMGRFMLTLLGAIAELEAGIIGERRRESLESFAREGRHAVGKAPWGFVSVDNPNGRGLVIRVDESLRGAAREVVRRIVAGESQERVRRDVGLSKTGMHKWLRNPRLAGMTPDGEGVVHVDGVPRVDPEAALLTMGEWRELEEYLGESHKTWSRRESYAAVLHCGTCGQRMYLNVSKAQNKSTGATHDTYVCRRDKHAPGEGAPAIMAHRADHYLESRFLSEYGARRAVSGSWSDSLTPRNEAISAAEVRLAEAQRRFAGAVSDEDEEEAMEHLRSAKRALKAAQAERGVRLFNVVETGRSVAEEWHAASPAMRCRMLNTLGRWTLHGGRAPVEQRITLTPDELLGELATHAVGSPLASHDDRDTFLMPSSATA